MIYIFLKALIIGFSLAMPVGPVGMLCIKDSLSHGFKIGISVGLGAAFADCFYGFIAAKGLAFISQLLLEYSSAIKIVGGAFLVYIGGVELKNAKKVPHLKAHINAKGPLKTIVSVFFLTLANPATIIIYIGIFASIGIAHLTNVSIIIMVLGVFLGSLSWWLILSGMVSKIRHKVSKKFMIRVKTISGSILLCFGFLSIASDFL